MKRLPIYITALALSSIAFGACNTDTNDEASAGKAKDFKFINSANMDTTVSPADNFFLYANGTWLKNTTIPGDQTRWGSFNELSELTLNNLDSIMHHVVNDKNATKGSNERIVADFYKSGMDTVKIEAAGITPMKPILDRIQGIANTTDLLNEITKEHTEGMSPVFKFYVYPDDKDVTKQICQFYQGGLGLSSKGDYFEMDKRSVSLRASYIEYIENVLVQMGEDKEMAKKNAQTIFNLEKNLASGSLTPIEQRDPQKLYNKFDVKTLNLKTPNVDWSLLLAGLNVKGEDTVLVGMPEFFKTVSKQIKETPLDVWKQYLAFHSVSSMASYLSKNFSDLKFGFYGTTLSGQKEQQARWKRIIQIVDGNIGDALGQLYVKKYFPADAKKRMDELVKNLQTAFSDRIKELEWMSDVTKQKALAKLNSFTTKIAYPDKWKDYSSVSITDDNFVQNVINSNIYEYNRSINKLGKPIDKSEWGMTPSTINAYYNPGWNEIVFPAGILQFPFFDFNADDAVNYGGIGGVIGHEMTHGFDDQGAQYDAEGYLRNWWTPVDSQNFAQRTDIVRKQFDKYTVLDTIPVKGSLTLGENLADLGGIAIAYEAFKKTKQGKSTEMIDGFTPDQRFFLSWAQVWRGKSTPERTQQLINTDPHSPEIWRVNGPLSNFLPFYKAFDVKEGDNMWRPDSMRANIW